MKFVNRNDANGYYRALGLPPTASKEQIRSAYLSLIKRLHPDGGGDEDLFRFIVDVADVLLDEKSKIAYDSVGEGALYLGSMEREELARSGLLDKEENKRHVVQHWACVTTPGFSPGRDTDAWTDLCWEASSAVEYRGKIRVGVLESGPFWPFDQSFPWGILADDSYTFMVFQRGIKPNKLHALCAMISFKIHLLNQTG